ncbi:MAG: molybdopterin-dependent oxidoreductase [Kiloniellales bacterium]
MGLLLAVTPEAHSEEFAAPTGPVILTVSGAISNTNEDGAATFDDTALEALGLHQLRTSTAWTDGVSTFEGPLLCALLDHVGAEGDTLVARALNDYTVEIPIDDCRKYPVVLALRSDGRPLSVRDKGPIWIVYPRDDHPELANEVINSRWIWQLEQIEVR